MGAGDTFHPYSYVSDDGHTYNVKLSALVAAQGGFSGPNAWDAFPGYPYHASALRHVWGVTSGGKRTRLPCATPSNSLFVSGGSFTLAGGTYAVEGQIGEARRISQRI